MLEATLQLQRGALRLDVALRLPPGVTVLLGPSGVGKSTTLDLLAGHLRPDAGRVTLGGALLLALPEVDLPPRRRRLGYVTQAPALFPHLTVADNLAYGVAGLRRGERQAQVEAMAERLGVAALLGRYPATLSGGEQQRVALGRALLPRPRALLLDEPLSAVDGPARRQLLVVLQERLAELSIPVLYVTHDEDEARRIGSVQLRYHPEPLPGGGFQVRGP